MSLQKLIFVFVLINSILVCNSAFAVKTYAEASAGCASLPASDPEIDAAVKSCMGKASTASTMCFESTSPTIKTGMTVVGSVLSAVKMASPADSCSGFAKAMDTARNIISAFNLACGGAHALCDSNCSTVMASIEAKKAANIKQITTLRAEIAASAGTAAALEAEVTRLTAQNAGLVKAKACTFTLQKTCNSYTAQLTAGAAGVLGLVIQSQAADTCNAKLSPSPTPVDCSVATNATLAQCICEKTPRASGCEGYKSTSTSSADNSSANNSLISSKDKEKGGGDFGGGGGNDGGSLPTGSGGSGGGGFAGGGGGKGIDGGLGSAAGTAKKDAAQKTGINTNILGGDYGGGGGSRGGGRSSTDEAMQSQYKNFLPGEKNDPSRNVANDSASGPLTGSGGKTNWDKVRERYDDNY